MNLDRRLIVSLLDKEGGSFEDKIKSVEATGHTFEPGHAAIYNFVKTFYQKHKKLPSPETVTSKYPVLQFKGPKEPFDFYIDEAIKNRRKLLLAGTLTKMEELLSEGKVDQAMSVLITSGREVDLREKDSADLSFKDGFDTYLENYASKYDLADNSGYKLGVPSIDEVTFGIFPGDYWLLIGRPGSMKTWVMCMWAVNMLSSIEEGGQIVFFSKEMKARQIYARMLAIAGEQSYSQLRRYKIEPKKVAALRKKVERVANDIIIVDSIPNAQDVQMKLRQYNSKAFFLDGLYLFSSGVDWDKITAASQVLRNSALTLDIPAIVSSQFSRKGSKDMSADNIGYSDALYQDGSVVIGQERVYDEVQERKTNILRWKIMKNREEDDGQIIYGTLDFNNSRIVEGKGDKEVYWDIDDSKAVDIKHTKKKDKKPMAKPKGMGVAPSSNIKEAATKKK